MFPAANVVKAFNAVFAEVYEAQNAVLDGAPSASFMQGMIHDPRQGFAISS